MIFITINLVKLRDRSEDTKIVRFCFAMSLFVSIAGNPIFMKYGTDGDH